MSLTAFGNYDVLILPKDLVSCQIIFVVSSCCPTWYGTCLLFFDIHNDCGAKATFDASHPFVLCYVAYRELSTMLNVFIKSL